MSGDVRYKMMVLRRFKRAGLTVRVGAMMTIEGPQALDRCLHLVRTKVARPADPATELDVELGHYLQRVIPMPRNT